ncbi:MAG: glucose-6-phosphate isomerase [Deltaproteobacteria bacterium]|nr:MAG: glucose-6-phosphate isomerase [Deltaproteobacteria bacterium]
MSWKGIWQTKSYRTLQKAAAKPYDLSRPDALTAGGRMKKFLCQSPCYTLFYAAQRVDEQVLGLLAAMADECRLVEQFRTMRRGSVMNNIEGLDSEERQVLHTASRDIFSDDPAAPEASARARAELKKLELFLDEIESGEIRGSTGKKFDTIIQIGIGGSDLGPRAVFEALKAFRQKGRKAGFIANVDPDDAAAVLGSVNLERCLVNIVSKSGTTIETLTNEELVKAALREQGLKPSAHCIAVTGQGSPLDNPENYLRSFYMHDYIGGRYSVTSMVGGVTLAFVLGMAKFTEFLQGAAEIDILAESADFRKNLPLIMAMLGIWNRNFLGLPHLAVLPYSQPLHRFPAHLQQCDMESNGKSIQRSGQKLAIKSGPVLWGEPGTGGQHAFYQLLHQGTEIVPVEFIGFKHCQYARDLEVKGTSSQQKLTANMLAQAAAFAQGRHNENGNRNFDGNRPSMILFGERLTPRSMGALLAIYEAKIVFQGFAWNINSFDQEGVQLGKELTGRFLSVIRGEPAPDGLEKAMLEMVMGRGHKC